MLPAYSLMLGLLALFGFFALAAGVAHMPEFAQGFKEFGNNFAVPALFLYAFPSWFVGLAFAAIGIGALVPAATGQLRLQISTRRTSTASSSTQIRATSWRPRRLSGCR